jgi:hypothetical protein
VKIHRGSDAIGSWAFQLLVSTEAPIEEQWHDALTGLRSCAEELCARGILLPTEATVERWREFRPPDITTTTRDLSATLLAELEALIGPAPERGVLELNGDTRFDSLDGPRFVPGACELGVTVDSFSCWIRLSTYADIWMPYNVMAQSQWAVAELNAPRLRAALEAIEQIVGKPGYAEDSRFAKVDGYELRNHIVRGDVLDLQDMGYDESWIADRWPEPDPPDPPPGPAGE